MVKTLSDYILPGKFKASQSRKEKGINVLLTSRIRVQGGNRFTERE